MGIAATESIRRQNDRLHAGIDAVGAFRDRLPEMQPQQVRKELDDALVFLRHEVAPHAGAEERVFYREVARVLGVELGERMAGEHRYIDGLVQDLTELRHRVTAERAVPPELSGVLGRLVDIVKAHLRLEEEVLQRLSERLTDSEICFLYERMERAEFEAAVTSEGSAETTGFQEEH
ncbi:MAG: hemerythrin domain-containing protein [Candidatus Dormibacteraeota bacterium]|nr:hemerythrin domain-containing protein [Candidatus Dormibacteraeota bacterium]MBV9526227.1 hemerythrin domain-containing protein [Candidatus Dormibacteraeota bacterium]